MTRYKISVIIPTFKPKEYIYECLASIKVQTFPQDKYEIVLVLNGCCEPWKGELESYISANMSSLNVKLVQIDQGGVSNARNVGIDMAEGEYVTFIDDDDYVSPSYLEGLYKVSSEDTIGLCYPYAFNDGKPNSQISYSITESYNKLQPLGQITYQKARKYFAGPCMKLIPMSFIHNRRFNVRFKNGEDSLFMFLISDHFQNVAFADKDVCYYRRYRSGSAVTAKQSIKYKLSNNLKLLKAYCSIYFSSMQTYNFSFFITRILGTIKKLFV